MAAREPGAEHLVVGEPRWHMASAVIAAIILTILMPDDVRLGPNWLLPVIVGVLLTALIASDPGRIDRRTAQVLGRLGLQGGPAGVRLPAPRGRGKGEDRPEGPQAGQGSPPPPHLSALGRLDRQADP